MLAHKQPTTFQKFKCAEENWRGGREREVRVGGFKRVRREEGGEVVDSRGGGVVD